MTDKSRNFRSSYYDKVGFRGVEEKKSLEILINEKPMEKEKLSKFCLRFTLPSIYREYVWKVILGVIPVNVESHKSIMDQRSKHYKELEHSLNVMSKVNSNTSKSIVHTLMFLMTEEFLEFDLEPQLTSTRVQNVIALASLFIKLTSTEVDGYWIFRNFIIHQRKFNYHFKSLRENLEIILKKEDEILYEHFKTIKALEVLPTDVWFGRYFAEILHESSLARVCDRLIGGNCKILPYVGAAMLVIRRHVLLSANDPKKIVELLMKIPEDISEVVVNKTLDLYCS